MHSHAPAHQMTTQLVIGELTISESTCILQDCYSILQKKRSFCSITKCLIITIVGVSSLYANLMNAVLENLDGS